MVRKNHRQNDAQTNVTTAQEDLTDYLAERSELQVRWVKVEDSGEKLSEKPVALTDDDEIADVADFPSGKYADDSSTDRGSFSHKTFIRHRDVVADFLESQDVADLQDVTPREVNRFNQRLQRNDYARSTRDLRLQTLKVFFEWAESEWRAPTGEGQGKRISETIARKRDDLDVSGSEKSRAGDDNHKISQERAEEILGDLARYDYASRQMVEFLLLYHVGCRASGLLSINVGDVKPRQGIIQIRNRPCESGIRLKKGNKGERDVNVADDVMTVVTDYIENNRSDPKDDSDALFTSWAGRIDESTLYRDITGLTKCGDCTDNDGDPLVKQNAGDCPESVGPHDIRRTCVTVFRDRGISWDTIGGRVNASPEMLREHYDSPSHSQAAERRRKEILNAL
ncbi:tyrosine-type recombinase/integrase [Halobium palmae]|uniref:Tyrosine-type recombinase/integrase n=1 Tax=Halobium palmae TaxID=1776492 RepID=A0ABD5RXA1_9EURY